MQSNIFFTCFYINIAINRECILNKFEIIFFLRFVVFVFSNVNGTGPKKALLMFYMDSSTKLKSSYQWQLGSSSK